MDAERWRGGCPNPYKFYLYRKIDMLLWKFKVHVSASGREDVQGEVNRYDDYSREHFSAAVRHLAVSSKNEWNEPHGKKLKGEDPLYEIRFKANRCATRAIGYFDDDGETFVITNICTHKHNVYKPHDAFGTAHKRRKQILDGTASTIPLQVDGENFPPDEE